MKANEFIKENNWLLEENMKELKDIISDAKDYKFFCLNNFLGHSYDNHGAGVSISIDDLRRLVESRDLVQEFGENSSYLKDHLLRNPEIEDFYFDDWCETFTKERLQQAITDVESYQ